MQHDPRVLLSAALVAAVVVAGGGCTKTNRASVHGAAGGGDQPAVGGAGTIPGAAGSARVPAEDCGSPHGYPCAEMCRTLKLIGGGRALGACPGIGCRLDLRVLPKRGLEDPTCHALELQLDVSYADGTSGVVRGTLKEEVWEQLALVARALETVALEPNSGCSTCRDGDEAWLRLYTDSGPVEIHYPRESPPQPIRSAAAFMRGVIDQLYPCSGSWLQHCSAESDVCRFSYVNTQRGTVQNCVVPIADASPCRSALACLCQGDVLPARADGPVEPCIQDWLTPRGAPTFTDFCASSINDTTYWLIEALTGFADTYQGKVTANAACVQIGAFY